MSMPPVSVIWTHEWPDVWIFAATYLGLALGGVPKTKLDRSAIALLGAIAVLLARRLSFSDAMKQVSFPTLALLISLMVISAQLRLAGFYQWVVLRIVEVARRPRSLLWGIIAASAGLSALFANDVICLIFTPVLCIALKRAGRDPVPYLMALVTSSNIGSAATLIGNPQNMLISQTAHLDFFAYSATVIPLVLAVLLCDGLVIGWVYGRRLSAVISVPGKSQPVHEKNHPDWGTIRKTLFIMTLLLLAMLFGTMLHLPIAISAMTAAGLVMISRKTRPAELFSLVSWNLILLFVGLFIVVGDIQSRHLLSPIITQLASMGVHLDAFLPLSLVTLVLSNLVNNVPAVLLLKPAIPLSATLSWYVLAVISTFAGNFTMLGSIANLLLSEQAKANDVRLDYVEYLKVGIPVTLLSVAMTIGYFTVIAHL